MSGRSVNAPFFSVSLLVLLTLVLLSACSRAPTPEKAPAIHVAGVTREERCLSCHADTRGIGSAHEPKVLGCSPCHGGDPAAEEKQRAHRNMTVVTGNLANVMATCGQAGCHTGEAARVLNSPMTTAAGIVAIDKFAFAERDTPAVYEADSLGRLPAQPASPAEDHVRKLCSSCHLGLPKEERGDQGFFARGGGCTACHLGPPLSAQGTRAPHPSVTSDVSERRCEGCHARSGRISLSYRGIAEVEAHRATEHLPDGRPVTRTDSDVHARAGLTCIDCHSERDVMGDGVFHAHASEAVEVRCVDCHGRELRTERSSPDATAVAALLAHSWERRGLPSLEGRTPVVLPRGTPLYRTDASTRSLLLAASGQARTLTPLQSTVQHALKGHERLSCQACHTTWAPRCGSCHTERVGSQSGFDHLSGRASPGLWNERAGENDFGLPALALDASNHVVPFVEGMTLSIHGVGSRPIERSLWAPLDAHTTGVARPCASCHGRASDARVIYPERGETTRIGARLLSSEERARIAEVGECLPCHAQYGDPIYRDFSASLTRLAARHRAGPADPVRDCKRSAAGGW